MRRRRRRDEWRSLVAEWKRSGVTATEFAKHAGVHVKTLQYWKYKLASAAEPRSPELAKIVEVQPARLPADERFEVRLAGGRCVGVPPSFDADALERLLRVLEAAS